MRYVIGFLAGAAATLTGLAVLVRAAGVGEHGCDRPDENRRLY